MEEAERLQRSWERRHRTMKRYRKMALTGMALAFAAGLTIGWMVAPQKKKMPPVTQPPGARRYKPPV